MPEKSTAKGWRRHLDGWQAGAIALVIAGGALILGMPRAAEPEEPPAPRLDNDALARVMARDDDLARGAMEEQLDVEVRALGRELRSYNAAAAAGQPEELAQAKARVVRAASGAAASFPDQVLQLRAYQLARFLGELAAWQRTGDASDELSQLGGDFLATMQRNRWCRDDSRDLLLDERELRVLFKKRWSSITGLESERFALTLDEERVRLGLLIRHPFRTNDPILRHPTDTLRAERHLARQRLASIQRLAELDPTYPADLARGVILYRNGEFAPATEAFRLHLERHPDGPHTLRARNFLKASLDRVRDSY